jgi:hypothetical protein
MGPFGNADEVCWEPKGSFFYLLMSRSFHGCWTFEFIHGTFEPFVCAGACAFLSDNYVL